MSYSKDECSFIKNYNGKISPKTYKLFSETGSKKAIKYCNNKFKKSPCSNNICDVFIDSNYKINPYTLKPFSDDVLMNNLKNRLFLKCSNYKKNKNKCVCNHTKIMKNKIAKKCEKFEYDETINPYTNRKIKKGAKTWRKLKLNCNLCKKPLDIESILYELYPNKFKSKKNKYPINGKLKYDQNVKDLKNKENEIQKLSIENKNLIEKINDNDNKINSLLNQIINLNKIIIDLKNKLNQLIEKDLQNEDYDNIKIQYDILNSQLQDLNNLKDKYNNLYLEYNKLLLDNESLLKKLDNNDKIIQKLIKDYDDLLEKNKILTSKLDDANAKIALLENQIIQLKNSIKSELDDKVQIEEKFNELQKKFTKYENLDIDLTKFESEILKLESNNNDLKKQNDNLKLQYQNLLTKYKNILMLINQNNNDISMNDILDLDIIYNELLRLYNLLNKEEIL